MPCKDTACPYIYKPFIIHYCAVMEFRRGHDNQNNPIFANKQLTGIHHKVKTETQNVMDTLACVKEYLKSQSSVMGRIQVLTEA